MYYISLISILALLLSFYIICQMKNNSSKIEIKLIVYVRLVFC